jgi:hypothetical protein
MNELLIVFVHGYSVTNLDTYGGLPLRLYHEGISRGFSVRLEYLFLGRYVSFSDQVTMNDLVNALETAVSEQVTSVYPGKRFVFITHSTGGPLVRTWLAKHHHHPAQVSPLSHLVMLAPANHGSALAQLGKTRLSRIKSWFDGVEPGQRILDWLEHGSAESLQLNADWIRNGVGFISPSGYFPFVLTGKDIDRRLYDHVNSYTGEPGSDGVIRVASANLNSRLMRLVQKNNSLEIAESLQGPIVPLRIISRRSHSGDKMGIMRSVKPEADDPDAESLIDSIFGCIGVNSVESYVALFNRFVSETAAVQKNSLVEIESRPLKNKYYIHDRYCLVVFRVTDDMGNPLEDFDLLLTAGPNSDPDDLPPGFFQDRQCNQVNRNVITYYFNYDLIAGCAEVRVPDGELLRNAVAGADKLGLVIRPRPSEGFVSFETASITASESFFRQVLQPDSTCLVDIVLTRKISKNVFRFQQVEGEVIPQGDFRKVKP